MTFHLKSCKEETNLELKSIPTTTRNTPCLQVQCHPGFEAKSTNRSAVGYDTIKAHQVGGSTKVRP
jgi:penicillin-binding protein-related factor A (putative recombinase)